MQTIVVNKAGVGKVKGENFAEMLSGGLFDTVMLYSTEIILENSPKPFGKKPKGW